MKRDFLKILTAASFVFFVGACSQQACKNKNPVFDQFLPETKEYKEELVKQLKGVDPATLNYYFDHYQKDKQQESILVSIQGEDICVKAWIKVKVWTDLVAIQKTKGQGYKGAELKNLKFDIQQDSSGMQFVYKSLDAIID